jgi:signal transduction histidine kinase
LNREISNQNVLLEEENKTKNKLLSIISHDLRTPLVNTKGILNLVNQGMIPPEENEKLMLQLEAQYQSTTSLLDNLLFWIKGQVNGNKNENVSLNFHQLVKVLEDEQRISLTKKNIYFENNIDKSFMIIAEKEIMRIVFRNLISNAIKFTPSGTVWVTVKVLEDRHNIVNVRFSIKDTGIGFSPEDKEMLGTKFYRSKKALLSHPDGSGLGLYICRNVMEANRGQLFFDSPGENRGATFGFRLEAAK